MTILPHRMSPSATQMIRADHAMVFAQYHRLGPHASAAVQRAAVRTICAALEIHLQIEEEIFYPALRRAGIDAELLDSSVPEHDRMRHLVRRLREADGDASAQARIVDALMNGVLHHVADEETRLLPTAERVCTPQQLAELGARMTQRKRELAPPRAGALVTDVVRAAPAKSALVTMGAVGALAAGVWLLARHNARAHDMAHRVAEPLREAFRRGASRPH